MSALIAAEDETEESLVFQMSTSVFCRRVVFDDARHVSFRTDQQKLIYNICQAIKVIFYFFEKSLQNRFYNQPIIIFMYLRRNFHFQFMTISYLALFVKLNDLANFFIYSKISFTNHLEASWQSLTLIYPL